MFAERDTKFDLLALGFLVLVAFLSLSLATYDPADPYVDLVYPLNQWIRQESLTYPLNETTANACGPWGALAASMLLKGLGLGAYYAVGSLTILTVMMLMRREISSPILRTAGWIMSLVGFTTISALLLTKFSPGSMLGAGGSLGLLISTIFKVHFATVGGLLLAISLLIGGLLLCTDYVLVHAGLMIGTLTMTGLMGIRGESRSSSSRMTGSRRSDVPVAESDEEDGVIAIRVGGKHIVTPAADEVVEVDDDAEAGYDDEDDEAAAGEDEYEDQAGEECDDTEEEPEDQSVAASLVGSTIAAASIAARRGRRRLAALRVRRPPETEDREVVMQQLDEASELEDQTDYDLPAIDLLSNSDSFSYDKQTVEVRNKAKILEKTFQSFGYNIKVVEIETGPVIAQYEVELESGLRLSKITGLADDLAIALRVPSVRIVAPIPGKNTVGIEVPNEERQLVRLRKVMEDSLAKTKKMRIPIFLGQDVSGNSLAVDLATMPHLLIAGRTGTGKSVCLNAIITSILMTRKPDEVRMLMIDPKMVELSGYKSLPHLMHPVVTDMRKAEAILAWAVEKMEERYALLAQAGVRHLAGYNQLGREELLNRIQPETDELEKAIPTHMPYIVIVADEIADMMMTAGKDVEQHIIRLAQKSRAVGIHLILATQKPTVDVITGLIKSNLPARVAFQVASRVDSRVVLDEMGAERLLGNGDMLFLWPGTSTLLRGQGTYVSDEEINSVVASVSTGEQNFVTELVDLPLPEPENAHSPESLKKRDELYERAIEVVVTEGRGSVSLLQRALGIGYGRAARLIDFMAEDGIVGTYAGSQAREVLLSMADVRQMFHGEETAEPPPRKKSAATSKPSKSNRKPKMVATPPRAWNDDEPDEPAEIEEEEEKDEELESDEVENEVADEWEEEEEYEDYEESDEQDEEANESEECDADELTAENEAEDDAEDGDEYEYEEVEYEEQDYEDVESNKSQDRIDVVHKSSRRETPKIQARSASE